MRKLIFYFMMFFIIGFAGDQPYVLMVSFDGFRHDFTTMADTPNFDRLELEGVKADALIPVFPSLTFPNHYSIATGAYSGTHNITGNSFYDKKYRKKYSLYKKETVRNEKFYKSEPIWVTAERQGVKAASFFWVGSEAPIKGYLPSIFKYYDGSVPFKARIDSVLSWFQLPIKKRPQLIMLYFSEPDHTGHTWGVNTPEIVEVIEEMDDLLGYLLHNLETLEIYSNLNLIIVSDHGMTNVSENKRIVLDEYISRIDDLYINGRGSHVQFDLKKFKRKYKQTLFKELEKIPHCQVWKKNNIPKRFHFNNNNTGEFMLLADEGWLITTQSAMDKNEFTLGGMHGYDPQLPNMHGIFYAIGTDIKSNLRISAFENIHIYPLTCKLLEIDPYSGKDDSPDGELQILNHILIEKSE
ncbi:MAG: alkaline phosphatase family protein [Candidatus Marinimicrobia bacterium]|nr:alkaline phosphatase family protein [Candidatus Neomarinimicrobiota bacterium]